MRTKNTTNLRNSGPVNLENGSLKAKLSYQDYLYKLLQQQIVDRVDRSVNARIKKAGFKYMATLDEFDFSFQPQIDEKLIRELATLSFLDSATNILLVGAPGVGGQTHLLLL